jgi:transposase
MPPRQDNTRSKVETLRETGALNSSPQAVNDPTFAQGDFFDPRDMIQVKYEMLRRVRVEHLSVTQAAGEAGLSRPTYYQVKARFDEAGIAGLLPHKRGPHAPHKLCGEVLAFVESQITAGQPIRARVLAQKLMKRFGIEVHPRTIERALRGKKTPR